MTTTPQEPTPDPEVVPSGDPAGPPPVNPDPTAPQPGEDPGAAPHEPDVRPSSDPF